MMTKEEIRGLKIASFEFAIETVKLDDHGKPIAHTAESLVEAMKIIYKELTTE